MMRKRTERVEVWDEDADNNLNGQRRGSDLSITR